VALRTCSEIVPFDSFCTGGALCMVCGGRAPNRCSGCKAAAYCSRAHQVRHWRDMGHKGECGTGAEAGMFSRAMVCS
jgi:hypothetical protein